MSINKGRSEYYIRKIENSDSIEDIEKINKMIINDLGNNPDTLTLDFYDPLIEFVYKKRSELEKMRK